MDLRHKDVIFFDLAKNLLVDGFDCQESFYHILNQFFLFRFCLTKELLTSLVADDNYFNETAVLWGLVPADMLPEKV